ncbi:hypothetical protein ACFWB1_21845 [Streptomyces goshikiensis]|uniref:hypothetical protein n=2 Tax=Streptomyces goshikiensis TaxID=1942 RepID=UPI003693E99F
MILVMMLAPLVLGVGPAYADAKAKDGKVGLSVKGRGLRVDRVGGAMDGHGTGVRARLITYTPEGYRSELTGWRDATPVTAALTKLSTVGWRWKGGREFADGTRLCIEFNLVQGEPCAVVHQ